MITPTQLQGNLFLAVFGKGVLVARVDDGFVGWEPLGGLLAMRATMIPLPGSQLRLKANIGIEKRTVFATTAQAAITALSHNGLACGDYHFPDFSLPALFDEHFIEKGGADGVGVKKC